MEDTKINITNNINNLSRDEIEVRARYLYNIFLVGVVKVIPKFINELIQEHEELRNKKNVLSDSKINGCVLEGLILLIYWAWQTIAPLYENTEKREQFNGALYQYFYNDYKNRELSFERYREENKLPELYHSQLQWMFHQLGTIMAEIIGIGYKTIFQMESQLLIFDIGGIMNNGINNAFNLNFEIILKEIEEFNTKYK